MKQFLGLAIMVCATISAATTFAQKPAQSAWQGPAISYGKVREMSDGAVPLNPEHSYKLIFNISQGGQTPAELIPGVVRAARFLNLAELAGVPKENVQLAVVIHGPATRSVLKQDNFEERFEGRNQNLDLFAELRKAGVEIFVCGQALAHMQLDPDWVTDDVEVATAALTVIAEYQLRGYHVMP